MLGCCASPGGEASFPTSQAAPASPGAPPTAATADPHVTPAPAIGVQSAAPKATASSRPPSAALNPAAETTTPPPLTPPRASPPAVPTPPTRRAQPAAASGRCVVVDLGHVLMCHQGGGDSSVGSARTRGSVAGLWKHLHIEVLGLSPTLAEKEAAASLLQGVLSFRCSLPNHLDPTVRVQVALHGIETVLSAELTQSLSMVMHAAAQGGADDADSRDGDDEGGERESYGMGGADAQVGVGMGQGPPPASYAARAPGAPPSLRDADAAPSRAPPDATEGGSRPEPVPPLSSSRVSDATASTRAGFLERLVKSVETESDRIREVGRAHHRHVQSMPAGEAPAVRGRVSGRGRGRVRGRVRMRGRGRGRGCGRGWVMSVGDEWGGQLRRVWE